MRMWIFLGLLIGCGSDDEASDTGTSTTTVETTTTDTSATTPDVSFKDDIWPIMDAKCDDCHQDDEFHPGFLMNTAAETYDTWLNDAPDDADATWTAYVVPGDAAASVMYDKVKKSAPAYGGAKMPKSGTGMVELTRDEAFLLRDWINQGALDN